MNIDQYLLSSVPVRTHCTGPSLSRYQEALGKPLWYNKNLLAIHGPLFKASLKRDKEKAIRGLRSIRQYFAPVQHRGEGS